MPAIPFASLDSRIAGDLLSGLVFESDEEREYVRTGLAEGNWRYRTIETEVSSHEFPENLRPEWTFVVWSCDFEVRSFYSVTPSGAIYTDSDCSLARFLAGFADFCEKTDGVYLEDWAFLSGELGPQFPDYSGEK